MITMAEVPARELLVRASDAAREYGISYVTLRMYWTEGARGYRLQSWREGGRYVLLLRSEVEHLKVLLSAITPRE